MGELQKNCENASCGVHVVRVTRESDQPQKNGFTRFKALGRFCLHSVKNCPRQKENKEEKNTTIKYIRTYTVNVTRLINIQS